MSGGCFEGYVVNTYGSYDVLRSGYKYIHYDLIDCEGYTTMTLTIGSYFVISFSPHLNSKGFICFSNFGVAFCNKFERGDWGLVIKVGVSTIIEHIHPFPLLLRFVPTHHTRIHLKGKLKGFGDHQSCCH